MTRSYVSAVVFFLLALAPASAGNVKLTWTASTPAVGTSGVLGYNVYRCSPSPCTPTTKIGSSPTNSYFDVNLSSSTSYVYAISAFDDKSNESSKSSGVTITTLANATLNVTTGNCGDIATKIGSAANGDTVLVPANMNCSGTPVALPTNKGITLKCATIRTCSLGAINISNWTSDVNYFYRISGFNLGWGSFLCSGGGCTGRIEFIRFDHNTWSGPTGSIAIFAGSNNSANEFTGLLDNNIVTSAGNVHLLLINANVNPTIQSNPLGTSRNLFFENNTMTITTMDNAGMGCIDSNANGELVWRYNTTTNCLVTSHGVTHNGGPQNFELYNNSFIMNSGAVAAGFGGCYRCFHHQGSGMLTVFNNRFTAASGQAKDSDPIEVIDYRGATVADTLAENGNNCPSIDCGAPTCDGTVTSNLGDGKSDGNRTPIGTYRGYPCWHQPGRDFSGKLMPMYGWNNKWSDDNSKANFVNMQGWTYGSYHIKADRDHYDEASSFNGTSGAGYGTLANRPTTCSTALTDAADAGNGGVGYFATDVGPQGTLYRCGSTNTWVIHYQPYTYPHPVAAIP